MTLTIVRRPVVEEKQEMLEPLNILQEADLLTMGDRQRDYDHPLPNHERIAWMWNSYFRSCGHDEWLGPRDVALMMVLLKIARQVHTPKRDNLVDICGYARCVERMDEPAPVVKDSLSTELREYRDKLRDISDCPPDCDLETWLRGMPAMLHAESELRPDEVITDIATIAEENFSKEK